MKLCPVKIRKGEPCDDSCPFRGWYKNPKTGEEFMSCSYLHKRIYTTSDATPADDGCATSRSV